LSKLILPRYPMAGKNITRADLTEAVYSSVGLTRAEAADLVEQVLEGICDTLATGETVKLSGFGIFTVRDKGARIGRNPKTGTEAPIAPRKSITFRPSPVLEAHVMAARRMAARSSLPGRSDEDLGRLG
jgi:integration host factor subunit alpha